MKTTIFKSSILIFFNIALFTAAPLCYGQGAVKPTVNKETAPPAPEPEPAPAPVPVHTAPRVITTLNADETSFSFGADGGEKTLTVTTNANIWGTSEELDWCLPVKIGSTLMLFCKENNNADSRTGFFYILAGNEKITVKIAQEGVKPYLNLDNSSVDFLASGGKKYIELQTNVNFWSFNTHSHTGSWHPECRVEKSDLRHICISCPPNLATAGRGFEIEITTDNNEPTTIKVNQEGAKLNVTPYEINFSYSGGRQTIAVSTNLKNWEISNKNLPQGFIIESQTSNSITVACDKKPSSFGRYGSITVKAGNLTEIIRISQE